MERFKLIFKNKMFHIILMDDYSDVHEGDYVKIMRQNGIEHSEGEVSHVLSSSDPSKVSVVLTNGDSGTVIQIINSDRTIEQRIMMPENQYSENKDTFGKEIMYSDVIPKTVQSFLNSGGGYLYIGVRDTGDLNSKLVGLGYDFRLLDPDSSGITNDKLCDLFATRVMDSLAKYLTSRATLGELIKINFPTIQNIQIAEIVIKKSSQPWFFRNISKNNKEKKFQITFSGERIDDRNLDDFYIRCGNSKKRLDTCKEFYEYAVERFTNR